MEWDPDELAVIIAFHEFARIHPSINLPDMDDLLKEYLLDTIRRLLTKYGWVVDRHDCENVLPLDKWAPEDRGIIKGIYQR